ncbi:LysE family translocator (plasmid) [Pseudoalteromonas xiamenensis]|uniref:LysE family translocator n=1 Tax=Pseudoalteromonas xiamenensis TaxID=882626 RepID=UPI0027E4F2B4|nr:LysE family translocator [Pseudoalteromonas xiamenensis]WMN61609.1 LysE family translocator [Pseudoalteromonas xiamenensis]
MIDISILPLFFVSVFFLVISPGPDLLLISSYSTARGFRSGIAISLGIFGAGILQSGLVAFGLGEIMQTMPTVAFAVKVIGACYLLWLGVNLIRAWFKQTQCNVNDQVTQLKQLTYRRLAYRGCMTNLLNPKALLFFSFFLPQFTHTSSSITTQLLFLGLLLSGIALVMNVAFSIVFSAAGRYFKGKLNFGHHTDGILGLVFVGLAARLVTTK